jgi:hypothetical protein
MYDLMIKAKTPGQPEVLVAANVTAAGADKLVRRLLQCDLAEDLRITPHVKGTTVENVNDRNAAHHEVLMAVLRMRESA